MNPPVAKIDLGDWVRIRRGGVWHVGEVVDVRRHTAHVRVGDDFLGYSTFVENLKILKSSQPAGGCKKPEPGEIDVANDRRSDNGNK